MDFIYWKSVAASQTIRQSVKPKGWILWIVTLGDGDGVKKKKAYCIQAKYEQRLGK